MKKGFTLIEIIVTLAIITILTSVGVPAYTNYINSTNTTSCNSTMSLLSNEVNYSYLKGLYDDKQVAFDAIYKNGTNPDWKCSNGCRFTWDKEISGVAYVDCPNDGPKFETGFRPSTGSNNTDSSLGSTDSNTPPTTGGTETVPNTNIPVKSSYWPAQSDYDANPYGSIQVTPAGVFKYTDGNYYIVNRAVGLTKSQAASGPGGEALGWQATTKITGRVVTYTVPEYKYIDLARGDSCEFEGNFYIFISDGGWGASPSEEPTRWYRLP